MFSNALLAVRVLDHLEQPPVYIQYIKNSACKFIYIYIYIYACNKCGHYSYTHDKLCLIPAPKGYQLYYCDFVALSKVDLAHHEKHMTDETTESSFIVSDRRILHKKMNWLFLSQQPLSDD